MMHFGASPSLRENEAVRDAAKALFKVYDKDGDGRITMEDLDFVKSRSPIKSPPSPQEYMALNEKIGGIFKVDFDDDMRAKLENDFKAADTEGAGTLDMEDLLGDVIGDFEAIHAASRGMGFEADKAIEVMTSTIQALAYLEAAP